MFILVGTYFRALSITVLFDITSKQSKNLLNNQKIYSVVQNSDSESFLDSH